MLSLDEQCKRDRGTNACFVCLFVDNNLFIWFDLTNKIHFFLICCLFYDLLMNWLIKLNLSNMSTGTTNKWKTLKFIKAIGKLTRIFRSNKRTHITIMMKIEIGKIKINLATNFFHHHYYDNHNNNLLWFLKQQHLNNNTQW